MGNDESAIPEVISVGATDNDNTRAWYSNYGENLDLVSPGEITVLTSHATFTRKHYSAREALFVPPRALSVSSILTTTLYCLLFEYFCVLMTCVLTTLI